MSDKNSTHVSGGLGFSGALTIVFIVLKLTGIIAWGWFYVFLPVLAPWLLLGVGVLLYWLIGFIAIKIEDIRSNAQIKRKRQEEVNRLKKEKEEYLKSKDAGN